MSNLQTRLGSEAHSAPLRMNLASAGRDENRALTRWDRTDLTWLCFILLTSCKTRHTAGPVHVASFTFAIRGAIAPLEPSSGKVNSKSEPLGIADLFYTIFLAIPLQ